MKSYHNPPFHATVPVFFTAPNITPEFLPARKMSMMKAGRLTFFLLLFSAFSLLLFQGIAVSYDYGSRVELISSDASGVLLELNLDDLTVQGKEFDNRYYHLISYEDCAFTAEVGKPRLPVSHVFLGIPPSSSISVSVVDSQSSDIVGYTPLPVPDKVLRTSPEGIDSLEDEFAIDSEFYRRNEFYPAENASLTYEGNFRHQRVAVIQLRPVQYNPASKRLRKFSRLLVRVNFSSANLSPAKQGFGMLRSDREFEKLYQGLLLNYDEAANWREARSTMPLAPAAPKQDAESDSYKIFVSKSGICRLDHAMLLGAGIDLTQVDPRTIKMRIEGNQIPIYVKGEADGRFDEDDYVEFFSNGVDSIYTRWDVYWLTWGGSRGLRMVQKSGSLSTISAREITFFESITRFEEDNLHHKLQDVQPDPDDPQAWFESRDHWFWDGIENGSAKNEVTVEFPAYDLAQTMVRPDFKIELVGCTDYDHNIMISVNGHKVGNEAEWKSQDIYYYDGQIPANALKEGINEVRLTRIGSNASDGSSLDNYPYQVYLNWFEIGYLRKLLAVNDSLEFLSPEPKDTGIDETNRYRLAGFLNNDIEIFQITDSNAVCRIEDVMVERYALSQDDRDRIKSIWEQGLGNESITERVPNVAYSATFDDKNRSSARYIAVTSKSIMMPDRIEKDVPSNLKDPSNQADYIIISHPMFVEAAERLADWRSGTKGGGFRAKVVDVTDVYDEFGSGMLSPHAVKDFIKFAYDNWAEPAPSYFLILGDATYDYLGIKEDIYEQPPEVMGFIPTFYLWTTFGQTAADQWYSEVDGDDGLPDIYLGRIPVDDISQAENVLDKIMADESGAVNGAWRKQIISIADDDSYAPGDEIFQIGLEEIWSDYTPLGYDTERIYLKDIIQQVEENPQETRRPAEIVREKVIDSFGEGAVIAQYSGHGGRHVWAHEIVFSIVDIDAMKKAEVYPFLLIFSCYNGYFDLPGELCMSEGLLRAKSSGAAAVLSATRLTYGTGNQVLNRLMFDSIFKEKMHRIGHVMTISKVRLLVEEGLTWLPQMQEYTLFGDPAFRLNISDHEVNPKLANSTVSPGGKLDLLSGQILRTEDSQPGDFNGEMTVSVSFPDGSETSKTLTAANGAYSALSFDVPANLTDSQGLLRIYGENASETVVGGIKFNISEPNIISINHEIIGDSLQFYADIDDDAGPSGIKSIILRWQNPDTRSWVDSPMIFDQQKGFYKLSEPISLSFKGRNIPYEISLEDQEGNSIISKRETLTLPSEPNIDMASDMFYDYSTRLQRWGVSVQISNTGTEKVPCSIQVMAFESNPDVDGDQVVDGDVSPIGQVKIDPDDWDDSGTVSAFIPFSLTIGRHTLFVWADPELSVNHPEGEFGECAEDYEGDNLVFKVLDITHALLTPGQKAETRSLDNAFHFTAPAGSVSQNEVVVVELVQDVQTPLNQPDAMFVSLPSGENGGYMLGSTPIKFGSPVSLQMKFDIASFREEVKNEIGLAGLSDNMLDSDQKKLLEQALKDKVSNIAIYRWCEDARKWANMPSSAGLDSTGNILSSIQSTTPVSQNTGDGRLERTFIEVDNNLTPAGEWVVFFTGTERFQLYFRDTVKNKPLEKLSDKTGYAGSPYSGDAGISFTVERGNTRFQFGDVLKFSTTESFNQSGSRSVSIDTVNRKNTGDGIVKNISVDSGADTPIDEWVILFADPQHFYIQSYTGGLLSRNNQPISGTVGDEFYDQETGLRFTIVPGMDAFSTGDKFRFKTVEAGEIQATSDSSGIFSLMFNRDDQPPTIRIEIADQNFADGDAVSAEPTIQALVSDNNGIDVIAHPLGIFIGRDGGDFQPAGEDEYALRWDAGSNDLPVNYWPGKLEPGEYEVKFNIYDFNGNMAAKSVKFEVKREFSLKSGSLMNYPNPFERETDVTFQLTSLADEAIVKIYTVSGRLIRTLENSYAVNFVVIHWDGRDEDGREVANGVYYYKVTLKRKGRKDIVEIGKMMKLK